MEYPVSEVESYLLYMIDFILRSLAKKVKECRQLNYCFLPCPPAEVQLNLLGRKHQHSFE